MGNCSGRGTMIVYLKHPFYIVYTHLQEQVTDLSENAELWLANTWRSANTNLKK